MTTATQVMAQAVEAAAAVTEERAAHGLPPASNAENLKEDRASHGVPSMSKPHAIPITDRYTAQLALLSRALENQSSYGRWLLGSLLAVHTGSLIAISQTGSMSGELFHASGELLVGGVVTALATGGLAWLNFTAATAAYTQCLSDFRDGRDPTIGGFPLWLGRATFLLTPIAAAFSLSAFVAAAWSALAIIRLHDNCGRSILKKLWPQVDSTFLSSLGFC